MREKVGLLNMYIKFALPWECPVPQVATTVNQIVVRYFTVGSIKNHKFE